MFVRFEHKEEGRDFLYLSILRLKHSFEDSLWWVFLALRVARWRWSWPLTVCGRICLGVNDISALQLATLSHRHKLTLWSSRKIQTDLKNISTRLLRVNFTAYYSHLYRSQPFRFFKHYWNAFVSCFGLSCHGIATEIFSWKVQTRNSRETASGCNGMITENLILNIKAGNFV